jgi:hypothetical protein
MKLLIILLSLTYSLSLNCITRETFNINSNEFISYNNTIYNMSLFEHPGGDIIREAYGKDVSEFWSLPEYNFHTSDSEVSNILFDTKTELVFCD